MGSALTKALLNAKIASATNITVSDPSKEKLEALSRLGVTTTTQNLEALQSDVLLLAVKPQQFAELAEEIAGKISPKTMVISIMAGVPIEKIQKGLKHEKVLRAMPNTPALVGKGVMGWFADPAVTSTERTMAEKILRAGGETFEFQDESLLNDVTALSGCGPGFFFALVKAWQEAIGATLHLPKEKADQMLLKTLEGSLALLSSTGKSPETLMNEVASRGGSTEAGLKELENGNVAELFAKMVKAAYNRCKEMG
jgi:pyrroline-5-carboxylate reductase